MLSLLGPLIARGHTEAMHVAVIIALEFCFAESASNTQPIRPKIKTITSSNIYCYKKCELFEFYRSTERKKLLFLSADPNGTSSTGSRT